MIINKNFFNNEKREMCDWFDDYSSYRETKVENKLKEETFYFNTADYTKQALNIISQSIKIFEELDTNLSLRFSIKKEKEQHLFKISYYSNSEKERLYKILNLYKNNTSKNELKIFKTVQV